MQSLVTERQWHVLYTFPKAERQVAAQITGMGYESFLPLCKVARQWSDRIVKLDVPLFPNYVFAKVDGTSRYSLSSIKGFVNFVRLGQEIAIMKDAEICLIRDLLQHDSSITSENYFEKGDPVRITKGQFRGIEGVVVQSGSSRRLLVRIEKLERAFSINLSADMVECLERR